MNEIRDRAKQKERCIYIALTVLMGSPLFSCSQKRKEFPKRCNKNCPGYKSKEVKDVRDKVWGKGKDDYYYE